MNELTVYNMPKNALLQFSQAGYYVFKVERLSTRDGNYSSDTPSVFTEIYYVDGTGELRCDWSGSLINNPDVYGKDGIRGERIFAIFSQDQDTTKDFKIDMQLIQAGPEISSQVSKPESARHMN